MNRHTFISIIGPITIVSKSMKITEIILNSTDLPTEDFDDLAVRTREEIEAYLNGDLHDFTVPISLDLSKFQNQVLMKIRTIPYGETVSYERLAEEAGFSKAYRAVGTACKNNPLPLIIPCHRVIKKNGDLGNYRYGMDLKEYLISKEKKS